MTDDGSHKQVKGIREVYYFFTPQMPNRSDFGRRPSVTLVVMRISKRCVTSFPDSCIHMPIPTPTHLTYSTADYLRTQCGFRLTKPLNGRPPAQLDARRVQLAVLKESNGIVVMNNDNHPFPPFRLFFGILIFRILSGPWGVY